MTAPKPDSINRRTFVAYGAAATFGAGLSMSAPLSRALVAQAEYRLKTEARFKREQSQYDSGMGAFRIFDLNRGRLHDFAKLLPAIEKATPLLNHQLSSFVAQGIASRALTIALKRRITDQGALETFVRAGVANLRTFLELDGAETVREQMLRTSLADREVVTRISERLFDLAARGRDIEAGTRTPGQYQFARTWAVVGAVTIILDRHLTMNYMRFTLGTGGATEWLHTNLVRPLSVRYGRDLPDLETARNQEAADVGYASGIASRPRVTSGPGHAEWVRYTAWYQAGWLRRKLPWLIAG